MTYIRKICISVIVVASMVTLTNRANAASNDTNQAAVSKKVKAKSTTNNGSSLAGQTDIVAKVDLPMVTNIMPWQEQEGSIPKSILDFSALKDSLTPTDRDRLASEIRYTSILNRPVDRH